MSAASLSVRAGFHLDSEDVQGLAHFCKFSILIFHFQCDSLGEHMLFLGTEKYPDEKEYNHYLNTHGGTIIRLIIPYLICRKQQRIYIR